MDERVRDLERRAARDPSLLPQLVRERARLGLLACGHAAGFLGLCLRCPPAGTCLVGKLEVSGYKRPAVHVARFSRLLFGAPYAYCMGDPLRSHARLTKRARREGHTFDESHVEWGVPTCRRCLNMIDGRGRSDSLRVTRGGPPPARDGYSIVRKEQIEATGWRQAEMFDAEVSDAR